MEENPEEFAGLLACDAVLQLPSPKRLWCRRRWRRISGSVSATIRQHDSIDDIRKARRGVQRNTGAHRVAHERRFRHADRLQEIDQKFCEHAGVIVRQRLVRLAESDLIEREHMEIARERLDVRSPSRSVTAQAVQQHHRRAASGFEVVQLEPENRYVFGDSGGPRLS